MMDEQALIAGMMGGMAPEGAPVGGLGGDPGVGVAAPEGAVPSPYPSTDPAFLDSLFAQVLEAQQMDHENLAGDQQEALAQSAMLQALIQGAPMGPGAGQEAQSVGFDPGVLPVPPQVQ